MTLNMSFTPNSVHKKHCGTFKSNFSIYRVKNVKHSIFSYSFLGSQHNQLMTAKIIWNKTGKQKSHKRDVIKVLTVTLQPSLHWMLNRSVKYSAIAAACTSVTYSNLPGWDGHQHTPRRRSQVPQNQPAWSSLDWFDVQWDDAKFKPEIKSKATLKTGPNAANFFQLCWFHWQPLAFLHFCPNSFDDLWWQKAFMHYESNHLVQCCHYM